MGNFWSDNSRNETEEATNSQHNDSATTCDTDVSSTTPEIIEPASVAGANTDNGSKLPVKGSHTKCKCQSSTDSPPTPGAKPKAKKPFIGKISDFIRWRPNRRKSDKGRKQPVEIKTQVQTTEDSKPSTVVEKSKQKKKQQPCTWFCFRLIAAPPKWVIYCLKKVFMWFFNKVIPMRLRMKIVAVWAFIEAIVKTAKAIKMESKIMILLLTILVFMVGYGIWQIQQVGITVKEGDAAVNKAVEDAAKGVNKKLDEANEKLDNQSEILSDIKANVEKGKPTPKETSNDIPGHSDDIPASNSNGFLTGAADVLGTVAGSVVNNGRAMFGKAREFAGNYFASWRSRFWHKQDVEPVSES